MKRALLLVLFGTASAALAGPLAVASSGSSDALSRAESALMDGDFQRAASIADGLSGADAARILGEAREAQGDLKGAAKAYAEAAQDPNAGAWLKSHAKALGVVVALPTPTPKPAKKATAAPTPRPTATSTPTSVPTQAPTEAPTAVATTVATVAPTVVPVAATTPDEALQAEREKLAKEREELEAEKKRLKDERDALKKDPAGKKATQGVTFYLGVGGFWAQAVDKFNDAVALDNQGKLSGSNPNATGSGPAAQLGFPLQQAVGLRWEGFVVEYQRLQGELDYAKPVGTGTGKGHATLAIDAISFGYDWAFIRKGTLLGPVELALPFRVEFGGLDAQVGNQNYNSNAGGPAFGLQTRVWAGQRFMIELEGLYHLQPGGEDNGSNNSGSGTGSGSGSGTGSNSNSIQLKRDGFEARLNLGWRFF